MATAQDKAKIAHRIKRDPGQPCLECIHHARRSSGNRFSHSVRT
jgi:hypothetical protein